MKKNVYMAIPAAVLLVMLAGQSQAAEDLPTVETTPIKGKLFLLQGRGGNVVASAGDDGVLLIDDDYTEYAEAYHQALKSISGTAGLPRFVINTHWHLDHVGTNAYWGERGAVIMAHDNVYQRMSTRQEMKALDRVVEASPAPALPVVTYDDGLTVRFNGDQLDVQHYPRGHTDGDSVVFFTAENVVHMGDQYWKDRFPFVDLGSGGNVLGLTANIARVLARVNDATVIVPGHGELADRADLALYLQMLESTTALVKSRLEQGMSVAAIAEQGLGEEWDSWGQGFIKPAAWVSFIAGSL